MIISTTNGVFASETLGDHKEAGAKYREVRSFVLVRLARSFVPHARRMSGTI